MDSYTKILIIDDDLDTKNSLKIFLERKGYSVITTDNAITGNELFEKEKPNLLILNLMLHSKFEGLNLLSKIKSDPINKSFPVIVFTSATSAFGMELKYVLKDQRFNPNVTYLQKPLKPEEIHKEIGRKIHHDRG